jgi:hypothetical protein
MLNMSDRSKLTDDEERALNVISVRGPFLCEVNVIHSDWFQTSDQPFEQNPDGFGPNWPPKLL